MAMIRRDLEVNQRFELFMLTADLLSSQLIFFIYLFPSFSISIYFWFLYASYAMASPQSLNLSMTDLSLEISTKVEELTGLLKSGSHPSPSIKTNKPNNYPSNGEMHTARYAIIDACTSLVNLAMGPRELMYLQALCVWPSLNPPISPLK